MAVSQRIEKSILPVSFSYINLYRFAKPLDWFLVAVGTAASIAHGICLPLMLVYFGQLTSEFVDYGRYRQCNLNYTTCFRANLTNLNETQWISTVQPKLDFFSENTIAHVYVMIYIGCGVFVLGAIQVKAWSLQAIRQTKIILASYFYSILRQDIGFHDVISSGELNTRLSSDIKQVKDGMGDKVSLVIQHLSTAIGGVILGLLYAWKVAVTALALAPLLGISTALIFKISDIYTKRELAAYAKAGSIAEEAISGIRTVVAFGCQDKEVNRYVNNLEDAKKVGLQRGFLSGFSIGLVNLSIFGMYGLAFWYGSTLVLADEITIGDLTTCFLGIIEGSYSLGTASSYLGTFSDAKAAGTKIFEVIDRVPKIDIFSEYGDEPDQINAEIKFKDVCFSYPSRANVKVLKNVSFTLEHGTTVALVGQSGSGKSTILQLIQRFYDVNSGSIESGNKTLTSLNLKKHRELIGVVAQEPVLFATTIAENIRWGRQGVSEEEIVEATKKANAYDFIEKLPKKLETMVGEGGGQMSGGQKQRIAIARAIVRNPKILLLDEATSALDTESETLVQMALERVSVGRTTVVVAHRLSTIRNADKIIAFKDGEVMEEGTHDKLLEIPDGVYSNLINMQTARETQDESENRKIEPTNLENIENGKSDINRNSKRKSSRIRRRSMSVNSKFQRQTSLRIRDNISNTSRHSSVRNKLEIGKKQGVTEPTNDTEELEEFPKFSFLRILKLNGPEWAYMAAGCLFAAFAGSADPLIAVVYPEVLKVFTLSDAEEQYRQTIVNGVLFLAIGVAAFFAYFIKTSLFAKSGQELTIRLRHKAFQSILRQDIEYFDHPMNSTGALALRLAVDAYCVKGCSGVRLGTIVKNCGSLGVSLAIAFVFSWKLTLVMLGFVPLIVLSGFIETQLLTGADEDETTTYEDAGQIAGDGIANIRTVASLTREQGLYDLYLQKLEGPARKATRKAIMIGLGYGFSQCVIFFACAATFRLGIYLVIIGDATFTDVFRVLTAVIFGCLAIGQNSSFAPDYAEAKLSASRMFALFDRVPKIDSCSTDGHKPDYCKGEIQFKSVVFHYPNRPDIPILKGCDIWVKPGQTLALVGMSGCGKSTAFQLIERFYDPDKGQVLLDGVDISKLNVSWLRQQIGLVSQESTLFDQTFKENILYGDCIQKTTNDEEVKSAAIRANIDDFITSLPNGYSTHVGSKGNLISGGQKQRVAIARAVLRNPKILLLDEATSALDAESEQVVQKALDAARKGRTSIVIAHRLSTVRNADQIAVIDGGIVVELGTHEELIAKKSTYYSLVNAQLFNIDETEANHKKETQ